MPPVSPPSAAAVQDLLRSRRFVGLLVVAAVIGALISVVAFGFLQLTSSVAHWAYTDLPHGVGFSTVPAWWPVVPLILAGLIVGGAIRYLPGTGGEVPLDGLKAGGTVGGAELPGLIIAAVASVALGPIVGPEAPLIALGGGLAVFTIRLVSKHMPERALAIIAAAGSFAAVSTLLGSPLVGAFLLMEVVGLAGATATAVLVPGLLGAGIGALIFTGLGRLTGHGTFSLAIPNLPTAPRPTVAAFGWALAIGLLSAAVCWLLRRGAITIRPHLNRWTVAATVLIGALIAGLAILFGQVTGKPSADVLFSGQQQLPSLLEHASTYSVGALLLLLACKGIGYSMSLVGFRGGPTFPAMFLGAAGGMALSHLPGLSLIPGAAMGIGAMTVGMLRLPFTAVLLTTLFLGADGITVMPLVIVAVVVAHVATIRLTPPPPEPADTDTAAPADAARTDTNRAPGP